MIHRFMPPGRIIYFGIDADSFRREGVARRITDHIENAALNLVKVLRGKDLGIAFAYTDGSGLRAFNICYDVTLPANTVAQSFFPSDPREMWHLGISRDAVHSEGFQDCIFNALAHEFAHILGLRHWNAGTDARERHESSMLWPGTHDGDRVSIMNTVVDLQHLKHLKFSEEDFRVIREVYSAVNGDVLLDGRTIVDIDPHSEYHVA
ncbi:hypothetical protein F5883DRAFT_655645 [Diaporthe sp. PMI_573]|nr:hypothetical protein F5883DRAFT_655645 [Diaporthaceae sp. PMI_573]